MTVLRISLNYTSISLLEVGECSFRDDDVIEDDTEIQLLQLKESSYIETFSCLINLQYQVFYCGMHSHNYVVKGGIVAETYTVTAEECKNMHLLRRARVYGQEFLIDKFNDTTSHWIALAGGIDDDGACTGDFCNKWGSYQRVVAHGQIALLFSTGTAVRIMKEDKIRLNSGITCEADAPFCLDITYGYTFWNIKEVFPCSDSAYHVVYQGKATRIRTAIGKEIDGSVKQSTMFSVKTN